MSLWSYWGLDVLKSRRVSSLRPTYNTFTLAYFFGNMWQKLFYTQDRISDMSAVLF